MPSTTPPNPYLMGIPIPILGPLIGAVGAIVGGFFVVVIWPRLNAGLDNVRDWAAARWTGRVFENRYLDWLIQHHLYLPILPTTLVPLQEGATHELDNIYVSLSVTESKLGAPSISLGQALHSHSRLVVLGDPGAGKTTMLRFLALTFARARRNHPESAASEEHDLRKVRVREARYRVRYEYHSGTYPLPIFVYLNRLSDASSLKSGKSLLDAICHDVSAVSSLRNMPSDFFVRKLERGECIFLFDAFDELASPDLRAQVAQSIGDLAAAAPAGNRFVVTSRIVGYRGQLAHYNFRALTIEPLSWQATEELVTKWYDALHSRENAEPLLQSLYSNPRLHELAVNPMLLSLIALVQFVRRLIPSKRHILYEECVKILVERRYAPPSVQAQYDVVLPGDEAIQILQKLAIMMHSQHLREVTRQDLESRFIPEILKEMPNSLARLSAPRGILHNIEERSQILVERGFDEMGHPVMAFSHLTFQEYLASVALRESGAETGQRPVMHHIITLYAQDPDWWEEVALLYAAQLDALQQANLLATLRTSV